MKRFFCDCGQIVFFDNTYCVRCIKLLGFDPVLLSMKTLIEHDAGLLVSREGFEYRQCKNQIEYQACNWLLPKCSLENYCLACRCNKTIPNLSNVENLYWWRKIESAKRYMLYGILSLGLPLIDKYRDPVNGLAFAFIEDRRRNPHVDEYLVQTGHQKGLITINLAEANDAYREQVRRDMGELYRTLLGHFRHEIGHYYFDLLIKNKDLLELFRPLFGDETKNYSDALQAYYASGRFLNWKHDFISAYAQVHPLEDWAECWAHYLHIFDGLETAADFGWFATVDMTETDRKDSLRLDQWVSIALALNSLNRSLGMSDAYPFILSDSTREKLHFVDRVIQSGRMAS